MFRLYKNFKKRDIFLVVLIIALTILQVYLTMTIVDYTQGIINAITYINYHNNPLELGQEFNNMILNFGSGRLEEGYKYVIANELILKESLPANVFEMLMAISKANVNDIWYNGLMMLLFAFGIMVVQGLISVAASLVAADLSTNIRKKFYLKVEGLSLGEINSFTTSSLITRTTNDIQQVQMANLMMMRMVFAAPVTAIWALFKIRASSVELTIATAIAIILLVTFIMIIMLIAIPKFKIMQRLTDRLNGVTRENLTGIRIIRAFNGETYQEKRFMNANEAYTKTQIFTGNVMSLMSPIMMIIMNGISLAIYWIGATLINKGSIDYATVTSFMFLSSQIIMSFVMLMMMFVMWPRASVSAKRINEVLDYEYKIKDPESEKPLTEEGSICFNNVSFKFPGSNQPAVSNLNFSVKKGETLAIIGPTGSGKSTISNLMLRLYEASSGSVIVDGVDVKDLSLTTLHSLIGYVPQKAFLFKGTIRDNIALGNNAMAMDDIINGAKIALADEFIMKKDEGYSFVVSQGGKNLSGGQKQRLCIARAVAMKPEILIFDDSFSALDYKTDLLVRENIKKMPNRPTKIIIAQRIGTIMDADRIIVLVDGKINGIGTHKELLATNEVYKEIALSQLTKEELGL